MRDHWTVEEIDPTDVVGLSAWASELCHELDISSAAEAINAEPTVDAVVAALTESLPEGVRAEVAKVCFLALGKSRGAQE